MCKVKTQEHLKEAAKLQLASLSDKDVQGLTFRGVPIGEFNRTELEKILGFLNKRAKKRLGIDIKD